MKSLLRTAAALALAFSAAGCSSSWKRDVIYSSAGVSLYREYKVEDGKKVPLGYRHPFELPAEKAAVVLSQLVYREEFLLKADRDRYVFTPSEVEAVARPLSLAVGGLSPDERLRFLLTRSNWTDAFLGMKATSGVIFSREEAVVDLAFDYIQEKISAERGDPKEISFHTDPVEYTGGSPVYPVAGMTTHADGAGRKYPRWLEVRLAEVRALAGAESAPRPATAGAAAAAASAEAEPATTADPPATARTPPPQTDPPPPTRTDEARYQRVRERLENLKRLRADGAITEEEYQKERSKTLSEL